MYAPRLNPKIYMSESIKSHSPRAWAFDARTISLVIMLHQKLVPAHDMLGERAANGLVSRFFDP